jgi:hypothetical protein
MGKGAEMTPLADRADARPAARLGTRAPDPTAKSPPRRADDDRDETTASRIVVATARDDSGETDAEMDAAWDITLTAGRTGGGLPETSDPSSRAALAERRLLETQQVLVQERAKREVAEAILAETAKALSAVRRAAADGGAASTSGVALRGGGEEAATILNEKLALLRADYDALRREFDAKDRDHARLAREVTRLEDGLDLTESGRPVRIDLVMKEMTDADQDELVMSSKLLLDRAKELEQSLAEFRDLDEQRVRTIADVVSTLEQRQRELKDKLRDAGLLDDEYDDEKVLREGLSKYMSPEARAAMGHMLDVDVLYEGPATSPLGKNFYATRTVSWWDKWFGIHAD